MVADAADVKAMQELVHKLAGDRSRTEDNMTVRLKTPSGKWQRFRMEIYKRVNEYRLTDKLLIVLRREEGDG